MNDWRKIEAVSGYWPNVGPMYTLRISDSCYQRVQELSVVSVVPPWVASSTFVGGWGHISTTDPEWFINVEEQIRKMRLGL